MGFLRWRSRGGALEVGLQKWKYCPGRGRDEILEYVKKITTPMSIVDVYMHVYICRAAAGRAAASWAARRPVGPRLASLFVVHFKSHLVHPRNQK